MTVRQHTDEASAGAGSLSYAGGPLAGVEELDLRPGEELLIRRVHLTDAVSTVYAVAEVVAVLNRLPAACAEVLLTTPTPLGKGLVAAGVAFTRELRRWGGYPAGGLAATLGPTLDATSVVPGRTYRMVSMETGEPLTVITEWFAPRVFEQASGAEPSAVEWLKSPQAAGD